MGIVKITIQIILLFVMYQVGVWIQEIFQLIIPGSIIGMLLLFLLLLTGIVNAKWVESGALLLIKYLPLLFLPITVGIITFFNIFIGKGFFIIIIVLISTAIVMVGSGIISQLLLKEKVYENE